MAAAAPLARACPPPPCPPALTAVLTRKRRRTQSSPSSPDLPSREPSLPYLRYVFLYLNMPLPTNTIGQVDGADNGDLPSTGNQLSAMIF